MTSTARRVVSGAIVLTLGVAAAILLFAHPAPGLRAALLAAPTALVAASVLLQPDRPTGRRWRPLLVCGILAYSAVAAVYAAGAVAPARFPAITDAGLLLHVAVIASTTRAWRLYARGTLRTFPLDPVIAGLAAAAMGGWLLIKSGDWTAGTPALFTNADLFVAGYVLATGVLSRWPPSARSMQVAGAFALLAAADAAFTAQVADGHARASRLVVVAWPLAIALFGAAVRRSGPIAGSAPSAANIGVPIVAAGVLLPLVIAQSRHERLIAAAALLLAGTRLSLSLVENLRLLAATNVSAARQEATAQLGRRALEGLPIDELMAKGIQTACRLTRADAGAFYEVLPDGTVAFRVTVGWPKNVRTEGPLDARTPTMAAAQSGEPVIVEDWRREPRYLPTPAVEATGALSTMVVAIPRPEQRAWALSVNALRPCAFDRADCAFVQSLANVLAMASEQLSTDAEIEQLAAARGRLVVETLRSEQRERQRISEALHDFALQELLAAGQDLDDAASEVAGVAVARVQRARAGVARAARDLREAVTELHPVVLHHAGLAPAIDAVAQRQAARAGFTYELELDDAGRAGYEDVLVSLVRELLANVARHAEARTVWVRLSTDADHVVLEVRDDGRGLDATRTGRPPSDGSGSLASWAVRLEALGGTLSVQAGPNGGTIARASLPLATDS